MGAAPEKTLLQEGTASLSEGQKALAAQIQFVSEKLEANRAVDKLDSGLSSHLAFLVEKQAVATREQRQLESHEIESAKAMTPEEADELVVSYVLELPVERRALVIGKLREGERTGSVL